jgi:uncharacterized damage-inducible protein DinB
MKDYFLNLLEFDYWTNARLLSAMQNATEVPQRAQDIFNHLIAASRIWGNRMVGAMQDVEVWAHFDKENWQQELDYNRKLLTDFLHGIEEEDLSRIVHYYTTKGVSYETSITDMLTHVFIHSGYHQGQIVTLIKPYISAAPDLNYITYIREKK